MELDEITISRAILSAQMNTLIDYMELDVAVVGAGPAGLTCATLIAEKASRLASLRRRSQSVAGCGVAG